MHPWITALRPHQWTKNVLLFAPLVLGHAYSSLEDLASVMLGFVLVCVMTSATYLVNDLADLVADRDHPIKRHRPLASGRINESHAR